MEELEKEISNVQIKIRQKINKFDENNLHDSKFEIINNNILNFWCKREKLFQKIENHFYTIENKNLIVLEKMNKFYGKKLNNSLYLEQFSQLVNDLQKINLLLVECVQHDQSKQYNQLLIKLNKIENLIQKLSYNLENKCCLINNKIYETFSGEMNFILIKMNLDKKNLNDKIQYDLKHIWDQSLKIKKENESNKINLTFFSKLRNEIFYLDEYFNALIKDDFLKTLLEINFSKMLIQELIEPILTLENTLEEFSINSKTNCDNFDILLIPNKTNENIESIFQCLSTLFRFLYMIFDSNEIFLFSLNDTISEIFRLLQKKVLNQFLSSENIDLSRYETYVKKTEELQLEACEFKLLKNESKINFSQSINVNFTNKICFDYIIKARNIIKKDFFPLSEIGSLNYQIDNISSKIEFDQSLFEFPRCKVSLSLIELSNLILEIMSLIQKSDFDLSKNLYLNARRICEIYLNISTIKKKKILIESLEHAAIFHNNCFYFAHNLNLINFNNSLKKKVEYQNEKINKGSINLDEINENILNENTNDFFLNFIDFIPVLRELGSEHLLIHMRMCKKYILDKIQSIYFTNLIKQNKEKNLESNLLEKNVLEVVNYLFNVKEKLLPILPFSVTNKIISTLFNTLIEEVFLKILKIQDISESNCNFILKSLNLINERLELPENRTLRICVTNYQKLNELKFVLKSNLQEISDRWCDGKGPLTLAFSPDQLKHLIRAVFQNTERRSAVLSKIK